MNPPNTASVSGSPKLSEILDQIEERANNATPPGWSIKLDSDLSRRVIHSGKSIVDGELIGAAILPTNADFIASSRTDVPKLVGSNRALLRFAQWMVHHPDFTREAQRAINDSAAILENRAAVGEAPDLEERGAV